MTLVFVWLVKDMPTAVIQLGISFTNPTNNKCHIAQL